MNKLVLRRICYLLVVMLSVFCSQKADATCIKVVNSDDKASYVVVDSSLEMRLEDEICLIVSDNYDLGLNIADFKHFQYVPYEPSSVKEISESLPIIKIGRDELTIYGCDKEEYFCRVHDTNGMLTSEFSCRGKYSLPLISFRKGVYILNVENVATVKFIVK